MWQIDHVFIWRLQKCSNTRTPLFVLASPKKFSSVNLSNFLLSQKFQSYFCKILRDPKQYKNTSSIPTCRVVVAVWRGGGCRAHRPVSMNDVAEVEGPGAGGGVTPGAAAVCGGWVPQDQPGPARLHGRGGPHPIRGDCRTRRPLR